MAAVMQVSSMAATDINTVLISQRMAAGTTGPPETAARCGI